MGSYLLPGRGYGLGEKGNFVSLNSLKLPEGYIKGTVGAGDAFCVGVLYGAQKQWPLEKSIRLGTCAAAVSLSEPGTTQGMRTLKQVLELEDRFASECREFQKN